MGADSTAKNDPPRHELEEMEKYRFEMGMPLPGERYVVAYNEVETEMIYQFHSGGQAGFLHEGEPVVAPLNCIIRKL